MRVEYSEEFLKQYHALPESIRRKLNKQLDLLLENPRYPSLNTKKLKGQNDLWQARIDQAYRFVFQMNGDLYSLVTIFHHR